MAVINKEKYLRGIALLIGKDGLSFDAERRPAFDVGGRKVFVRGVDYDRERGELTYSLCDDRGSVYPSSRGARPLAGLDVRVLSDVDRSVRDQVALRTRRTVNLMRIESRMRVSSGMKI